MAIAVETLRSGQEAQEGRRAQIERAIAEATDRKRHLLAAVSRGLATDDLLRELEAEGQRERALNRELEQVDRGRNATADQRALERELVGRVSDLRGLLGRHVGQARQILRRLLVGRLESFAPGGSAPSPGTGGACGGSPGARGN